MTQPQLLEIMTGPGLDITNNFGIPIQKRLLIGDDSQGNLELELPQIVTAWDAIYQLLFSAFPQSLYVGGKKVSAIESTRQDATMHFDDGSMDTAD